MNFLQEPIDILEDLNLEVGQEVYVIVKLERLHYLEAESHGAIFGRNTLTLKLLNCLPVADTPEEGNDAILCIIDKPKNAT